MLISFITIRNKLYFNHYQLNSQYTSNKITVDLIEHNHLNCLVLKKIINIQLC